METENPILQTFEVAGQTRHLTFSEPPKPKSEARPVPPAIKRLIGELGLRYRPTSQADLEAHAASLALLAVDLCDMPEAILSEAIRRHVTKSPYLPKAADLVALGRKVVEERSAPRDVGKPWSAKDLAARRNQQPDMPRGLVWCASDDGALWLAEVA